MPQIIDICLNVGLSQITNRFNATFLPDVDEAFIRGVGRAALEYPLKPVD
jgi:hypothetical protein